MRHAAERSVRIREVEGSNPFGSTKAKTPFSFEDGVFVYIILHIQLSVRCERSRRTFSCLSGGDMLT